MRQIFLFFTVLVLAFPAFASDGPDIKDVTQRAQDYLQNLKSARARFVQTTHDGSQLVGTFYLQRPGRLKFEYDDPIEDFVLGGANSKKYFRKETVFVISADIRE